MSFQEKSTLAVLLGFVVTHGWYFTLVISRAIESGGEVDGYQGLLLVMIVAFVILVAITHAVIALANPRAADANDERDKEINRFGEYIGGFALGTGALVALGLAMVEAPHFWIAHVILAALVLSELVSGTVKLVLYRRGSLT